MISSRSPTPTLTIGWPPLRAFRKNLATPLRRTSLEIDVDQESKKSDTKDVAKPSSNSTMFVKVKVEGCSVGRKIDLMTHTNYGSLSHALHKMLHNFLSGE